MRARAVLATLALLAAPAGAQEPSQQARIWKGTLGDAAITACFDPAEDGRNVYYRDAALETVRLEARDAQTPLVFTEASGAEDETGAVWTMQPPAGEAMTGEWRKGYAVLPVRLTALAVKAPEYGSICEEADFLEPLLAGGTYTSTAKVLDGMAYTELAYAGPQRGGLADYNFRTFAIAPASLEDEAINAALGAVLPDGSLAHAMGQCAAPMLANAGVPGYIDEALTPMLITRRWVALRRSGSSYCGGAHPNEITAFEVHDRTSGGEADTTKWFRPGALVFYDFEPQPGQFRPIKGLSAALTEAVMARWPEGARDPECLEAARSEWGWEIGLSAEGPVFVPIFPHVIAACTEEVTLPWKIARAYLSPEGRAVMAGLR